MVVLECINDDGGRKTLPEAESNMDGSLCELWQLQPPVQELGEGLSWSMSCTIPSICVLLLL